MTKIGFMQGRLSPPVDGRIQAFPWTCWRDELSVASRHCFRIMEWTLDHERLDDNPLMSEVGRREIQQLLSQHQVAVSTVTADFLMQVPPFGHARASRRQHLERVKGLIDACGAIGIRCLVWPLVDQGRLQSAKQEDELLIMAYELTTSLERARIQIAFESDYDASLLARLMEKFDRALFGINYDTGNSASLGFLPKEEFQAYGERVLNVHIKDRTLGGPTVPLGEGAADFRTVFEQLERLDYRGNLILQTARALDGDHAGALISYRAFVANLIASS